MKQLEKAGTYTNKSRTAAHEKMKGPSSCGSCGACGGLMSPRPSAESVSLALSQAKALGRESCAVGFMQRHHGNRATARMLSPGVQRKCSCGGGCARCKGEEEAERVASGIMRKEGPGGEARIEYRPSADPAERETVAGIMAGKGAGSWLDAGTRSFMEERIGSDFGDVRLHTDAFAARKSEELGAEAFTIGRDIFFGAGRYSPSTAAGKRLLAHELTHVVQQEGLWVVSGGVQKSSLCDEERAYSEDCSHYYKDGRASSEFYKCREANNYCGCGDKGYYMGYGYKYCERFNKLTRPKLSPAGQRWVDEATICLQEYLENNVPWDAPCHEVKEKAFGSHPECYIKSGICFLPPSDWTLILDTIDDIDYKFFKQAVLTGIPCLYNWLPLAFPVHSLSAGGGLRGLMERDRERLRRETGHRLP